MKKIKFKIPESYLARYRINSQFYDLITILFMCGILIYGISIPYEWFIFDDYLHILHNDQIKDFSWEGILYFWTNANTKIPITFHAWQALVAIFGMDDPSPYRMVNIILHSMNSILLYYFIQKLWTLLHKKKSMESIYTPALIGALFFLVHPVQVESVVWISSLKGVLSAFFSLLSLCFYLKTIEKPEKMLFYIIMMTITLGLAVLSKPSAVIVPVLFFVLDSYLFQVPIKTTMVKNTHILFLGILFSILQIVEYTTKRAAINFPWYKKIVMVSSAITKYLQLVTYPDQLKFNYGYTYEWIDYILKTDHFSLRLHLVTAMIFVWLIIFFSFYGKGKFRLLGFSLIFFIISISVNVGIVYYDFMKISTVADRYLYFPIVGFSFFLAFLTQYMSENFKQVYYAIVILVMAIFSFKTVVQTSKWKTNESYLVSNKNDLEKLPASIAEPLIGDLLNKKNYKEAFKVYAAHQTILPQKGENFAKEFLKIFGERKLYELGNGLLTLAKINAIKLDPKDLVGYYIDSEQFPMAEKVLKKTKESVPLYLYRSDMKLLKDAWGTRRVAAMENYLQIIEDNGLFTEADDYIKFQKKEFEEFGLELRAVRRLSSIKEELEYKATIRNLIEENARNKGENIDKVRELLKFYSERYQKIKTNN